MKRFLGVMLVVVLATGFSVSGGIAGEVTTITYWNLFTGGDGFIMGEMVKEFNRTHPSIKVEALTIKWEEYYTKLMTALAAKNASDVAICHTSRLPQYLPAGVFYPIDSVLKELNAPIDDYVESIFVAGKYEGKQYALPLDNHPEILYYNKDIMKAAGLVDDAGNVRLPEGKDQLISFAKKIKETTGKWGVTMEATGGAHTLVRIWFALLKQQNGEVFTEDLKKAAFNNEKGRKALAFMVDLVRQYKVMPGDVDYNAAETLFQTGQSGMHINGVWGTGAYEKTEGLNFGAVPLPRIFDKKATWTDSHTLVFPVQRKKDEKKLKAGVTFATWMIDHGAMWSKAGHIPVSKKVLKSVDFKAMKYRPDYAASVWFVKYVPSTPRWGEIEDEMLEWFEGAIAGMMNVEKALNEAETKVNSILTR